MKDISEIMVTEIRQFKPDVVPFRPLITASNISLLSKKYAFKDVNIGEDESKVAESLAMGTGEFKYKNKIYPIDLLVIERNKISLQIHSTSEIAKKLYQNIKAQLSRIDINGQFKKSDGFNLSVQTSCVATLNFDYHQIFSNGFNGFLSNKVSKACKPKSKQVESISIVPKQLNFDISIGIKNKNNKIVIENHSLRIEPRWGVGIKERRFFTVSPCDSETHIKLFSSLEDIFKGRHIRSEGHNHPV